MSTTWDDDETNATLSHLATLFARLDAAHERVLGGTNSGNQHVQRLLGECKEHLDLWEKEYIGTDGRKFRSIAARNEEQASRIRRKVDEANALMQHCEFKLRMPQRSFQGLRITEDNCRDDCYTALQRTLLDLQHPSPSPYPITAALIQSPQSANNPSTPPAPSPSRIATSASPAAMSSSRVSPASYDEPNNRDEYAAHIKQEQHAERVSIDLQDRSHLRKDSHLMPQSVQKDQPPDRLPPFSSFQPAANLAQIPSSGPYAGPILPRPSVYPSPSSNAALSPQSLYASSSLLNGNDQQTVMMSPNVLHPDRLMRIGPGPTMFPSTSIFYENRPTSKPSPPSPDS